MAAIYIPFIAVLIVKLQCIDEHGGGPVHVLAVSRFSGPERQNFANALCLENGIEWTTKFSSSQLLGPFQRTYRFAQVTSCCDYESPPSNSEVDLPDDGTMCKCNASHPSIPHGLAQG